MGPSPGTFWQVPSSRGLEDFTYAIRGLVDGHPLRMDFASRSLPGFQNTIHFIPTERAVRHRWRNGKRIRVFWSTRSALSPTTEFSVDAEAVESGRPLSGKLRLISSHSALELWGSMTRASRKRQSKARSVGAREAAGPSGGAFDGRDGPTWSQPWVASCTTPTTVAGDADSYDPSHRSLRPGETFSDALGRLPM